MRRVKTVRVVVVSFALLLLLFYFTAPKHLFDQPKSTLLFDRHGVLIAAHISEDQQWRFPASDSLPDKFVKAILLFEDQYFYEHLGVNPFSIVRALFQNIRAQRVVSGASTITAQVIRMSRDSDSRSLWQKAIEFFQALQIELHLSKDEILSLYASNAPFGGNVVGLDAAAWRYFGRLPHNLSWGEVATLAVLPNAPALIYPGKNHDALLKKRDRLLTKLFENGVIDEVTCDLAKRETLPDKPLPLPRVAPHLLSRLLNENGAGEQCNTTLDYALQIKATDCVNAHQKIVRNNGVKNCAALIARVETGEILAYVGNSTIGDKDSDDQVDVVISKRSTGSTLKPILYALMMDEGDILPTTLIPDIPTHFAGFSPKNFDKKYAGAVPAHNALARSLNIPAVRMLQSYGVDRFYERLKLLGCSALTKPADHYGLSLILGGAEISLWELTTIYVNMARTLNHFVDFDAQYFANDYRPLAYSLENVSDKGLVTTKKPPMSAGATWLAFDALTDMHRPVDGDNWRYFESSKKIAWKTGTSFGHRDAWAVGVTPEYVVAVWVGNADGEGRPGLTGASSAAPVMFDLFKDLPQTSWFETPFDELIQTVVCSESGYKCSALCENPDTVWTSPAAVKTPVCPYHKLVFLSADEQFQVNSTCYPVTDMVVKSWFVLPPAMAWYYKKNDPFYKNLPPYSSDCQIAESENMEVVYPKVGAEIYIPNDFGGEKQQVLFQVVHRMPETTIFWHLNNQFIGETSGEHNMPIDCEPGHYLLTLVDQYGEVLTREFTILGK